MWRRLLHLLLTYAVVCIAGPAATFAYPSSFSVSTLAYNPADSGALANLTIVMRPTVAIGANVYVLLKLPGFTASGLPRTRDNCVILFGSSGSLFDSCNSRPDALQKLLKYSSTQSTFLDLVYFDTEIGADTEDTLILQSLGVPSDSETSAIVCCFYLPLDSPANNADLSIAATSITQEKIIQTQSIKNSPELERKNYWKVLRMMFDPPVSLVASIITVILEAAQDLTKQSNIIVYLPGIVKSDGLSGKVIFSTLGTDWMYFSYFAYWDGSASTLTFSIDEGKTLYASTRVTLMTNSGDFILPVEIDANDPDLAVEARSDDFVDEIIHKTSVFQSDSVPHVRSFSESSLIYSSTNANALVDVYLTFKCNRPLFPGVEVHVKLAGFQTAVTEVPLIGSAAIYFQDLKAFFHLPSNVVTLKVISPIYFDSSALTVGLANLVLPPSLYVNDPSLLLSNNDHNAAYESILSSPMVGTGEKSFITSRLAFSPSEPENPSTVTITMRPSVNLFQGTDIILHLYGFKLASSQASLTGPDAFKFLNSVAFWNADLYTLTLSVAPEQVVMNSADFSVVVHQSVGLRLPTMLSVNDGVLSVETRNGAVITEEAIKETPAVGGAKSITDSSLTFYPADANAVTRIDISFTANTDILPDTVIYFKLGGLSRSPSGSVLVSGRNAPLFKDMRGYWDGSVQLLSVTVIDSVKVLAGLETSFFIEYDQGFTLPFAMYQNDPSLYMYVPHAGISEHVFDSTTQVNRVAKTFTISSMVYGDIATEVPYPGALSSVIITFQPNVVLLGGSVVRFHLPGFASPESKPVISPPLDNALNIGYRSFLTNNGIVWYGDWNNSTETLDLTVALDRNVSNEEPTIVRLDPVKAAFTLPPRAVANDPQFTISVVAGQRIYEEPIKASPVIVERSFSYSELQYVPRDALRTFMLVVKFTPTVDILTLNPIVLVLANFKNIDTTKTAVHLTGSSANLITGATATWNVTRSTLTMVPSEPIVAFVVFEVRIEESQGFVLPASLYRNDPSLKISSEGNILESSIRVSPLVGDGPYGDQQYCMYQYEAGIRYHVNNELKFENLMNKRCTLVPACDPWISDPCSRAQLSACKCDGLSDSPEPFEITGFNLYEEDTIAVIPYTQECSTDNADNYMDEWQLPSTVANVESGGSVLSFDGVRSTITGIFRVCVLHFGTVYDVGKIVVRPACSSPFVLVEGICMDHCPPTKVPVNGECIHDSSTDTPDVTEAVMVSIMLYYPASDAKKIDTLTNEDSTKLFFDYQFAGELSTVLDVDPSRIEIESISSGSNLTMADIIIVNCVFLPHSDTDNEREGNKRSSWGMFSLLMALLSDSNSFLYGNSLLSGVYPEFTRAALPVRLCSDGKYRTMCPFPTLKISSMKGILYFSFGTVATAVCFLIVCAAAWKIDGEGNFMKSSKGGMVSSGDQQTDVNSLDPSMKAEFARSWLEGRYVNEGGMRRRANNTKKAIN